MTRGGRNAPQGITEAPPAKVARGFRFPAPGNLYAGILASAEKQREQRIVNRSRAHQERQRKFFTVDEIRQWVRQGNRVSMKPRGA